MTLPAEDPRPTEGSPDAAARPDWLRGTDEEVGGVRAARAPAPPPRPSMPSDEETERLEGLVGPEFPSEPPPSILGERDAQLGVDPLSIVSTAVNRFLEAIKPAGSGSSAAPQPPPAR